MYTRIRHYRIHLYPYAMKDVPYLNAPFIGSSPLPAVCTRYSRRRCPRLRKILLIPLYLTAYGKMRPSYREIP